jgi:hypothetical protein
MDCRPVRQLDRRALSPTRHDGLLHHPERLGVGEAVAARLDASLMVGNSSLGAARSRILAVNTPPISARA